MRPLLRSLFLALAAMALGAGLVPAAGGPALPPRYQEWLEREVAYIITPREREVFLKLRTDRERDIFIEAFWSHRDPTPNTPENEFKTEHYRRLAYADHQFGRVSTLPGWKTDRGRMYIILGEPRTVERFEGRTDIVPAEVWFYQDKSDLGLPAGFHLVFFQHEGMGDFRLYSPTEDGPQSLIRDYQGRPNDYAGAYQTLLDHEPDLASVSLSLVPGDSSASLGRPSLASDMFLRRVEAVPQSRVKDDYARKFFEFKDIVEVEYSAHYIDSDSLVAAVRADNGDWLVSYALEPERLSVGGYGDVYRTIFRLNGIVTDASGRTVHQFDKSFQVKIEEGSMEDLSRRPFDMRDVFPLIPGRYKFSLLVKNEESKEFSSFDQTIVIPDEASVPVLTRPVLAYAWERTTPDPHLITPFQFGPYRVEVQPGRVFSRLESLVVAFQVAGLSEAQRREGRVRCRILKEGEPVLEKERALAEYRDLPNVLEEFPLRDLLPAHYGVKVALLFGGRESLSASEEFDLTFKEVVPRPWVRTKLVPGEGDVSYEQVLGAELFNAGRPAEAKAYLERAFRKGPSSERSALLLAKAYLALDEVGSAAAVLEPLCVPSRNPGYELLLLAGRTRVRREDWAGALELFQSAVPRFGVDAVLLGLIGDCQWKLGRNDKALAAWERSLELVPEQPEIRKKVEEAKARR